MTTLKEEEPFAFVLNEEFLHDMCSFCFSLKTVRKCIGCQVLSYCDTKCQNKDWVNHKKECQLLKSANEASGTVPEANVRLVTRLLLKSKKELAQKSFNGRSWEDLNAELRPMTEEMVSHFERQIDGIVDFMKPLKIVSREEAKSSLYKIINHNIDIFFLDVRTCNNTSDEVISGMGIYLGLSAHKHSCIPDAHLIFKGKKAFLRSFNREAVYSKNITFSYTPGTPSFVYQKNSFKLKYFTDCSCPICVDENHIVNRMGSSCRSTCCEYAAGILDFPFFVCNNCGADCEITVKEVRHAEGKIVELLALPKEEISSMNLRELKKILHDSEQVFSKFNFRFLNLCAVLANAKNYKDEDGRMFRKHASEVVLSGYSYYLPDTHKYMTRTLMNRAVWKLILDYLDDFEVDRTFNAIGGSYGEDHPTKLELKVLFAAMKFHNANEREKMYREAGKLNW